HRIRGACTQRVDVVVEGTLIDVSVAIDQHSFAARPEDAIHLAKCAHGVGKILKGCAAEEEIKTVFRKRHPRGISLLKIYTDVLFPSILFCDINEAFSNVETSDFVSADPAKFNRKEARPGCDFQDLRT